MIKWHKCFGDGEFNVNNSPWTGRPFRTKHDIAWIRDIVKIDSRKTVQEISDTTYTVVCQTIIHDLGMWKGCSW